MSEQVQPSRGGKKPKKPFTREDARATILQKLEKAGGKGVASFVTAKTALDKQGAFGEALASLEGEREIFADHRAAKPKYFLWIHRPKLPTREWVADRLEEYAAGQFPDLFTPADLKKAGLKEAVGKSKEAIALLQPAFDHLIEEARFLRMRLRKGKTSTELFAPASALRRLLGNARGALAPTPTLETGKPQIADRVKAAYREVARSTGFPAVAISALQRESGVAMPELKAWLLDLHRNGEAVLSLGDWSLASEEKRAGAIELNGDRYLLVQLT